MLVFMASGYVSNVASLCTSMCTALHVFFGATSEVFFRTEIGWVVPASVSPAF